VLPRAYLTTHEVNVIAVNWGAGTKTPCYDWAKNRVRDVGQVVGELLDFIIGQEARNWNRLTIVGQGLGAHVAGFAGRSVKNGKVGTIFGLDPAGPLYDASDRKSRLNTEDAQYTECIHTNWKCYGIKEPICTTDFYPNSGYEQPGCWANTCDHSRAVDLFAESLKVNKLRGNKCRAMTIIENFSGDDCCGPKASMGGEPGNINNLNVNGIYNVKTSDMIPFGGRQFYNKICWT